jgi:uncharacterized membrane protein
MRGAAPRLRQWWADLLASFWLRPAAMTGAAALLAEALVRLDGAIELPSPVSAWVYAGGVAGARDVLGTVATATIGVAGTTFSITVAALTLASTQMGPRLLRNFTSDPGNQYALGALLATFVYALVALRSVHEAEDVSFVPHLAVSVALLLAFACVAVLIWFIHHIATSISVDRVVALVHRDLSAAVATLPPRDDPPPAAEGGDGAAGPADALRAPSRGGYLRVLDEDALADWAAGRDAVLRLSIRPGDFAFPGATVGEARPPGRRAEAEEALHAAMALGETRNAEGDLEFLVRQLVEIALRALSPGINDPFTAVAVLDRLGATLCAMAGRRLPDGRTLRDGRVRLSRPVTTYAGLLDAMFHPLREAGGAQPVVSIRLMEVLAQVAGVEHAPARRAELRRHLVLARDAALRGAPDASVREAVAARHAAALAVLDGPALPDGPRPGMLRGGT